MPVAIDPEMAAQLRDRPDFTEAMIRALPQEELLAGLRAPPPAGPSTGDGVESAGRISEMTETTRAGEVRLRTYRPPASGALFGGASGNDPPVYLNLHGGGWVGGTVEMDDYRCRYLSHHAQCVVVSVDYYLAPEHRFPVALDQCEDIYDALRCGALDIATDGSRIVIGGSSAGGNLAIGLALRLRARAEGGPDGLMLSYPVCDQGVAYPSISAFAHGYLLTESLMRWFWELYLRDARDGENPQAVPMRATTLAGLPPSLIITAEADVLRDEAEAFAARLRADGVEVTCWRAEGVIHGFLSAAPQHAQSQLAFGKMAAFLRRAFEQEGQ